MVWDQTLGAAPVWDVTVMHLSLLQGRKGTADGQGDEAGDWG